MKLKLLLSALSLACLTAKVASAQNASGCLSDRHNQQLAANSAQLKANKDAMEAQILWWSGGPGEQSSA